MDSAFCSLEASAQLYHLFFQLENTDLTERKSEDTRMKSKKLEGTGTTYCNSRSQETGTMYKLKIPDPGRRVERFACLCRGHLRNC